MVSDRGRNTYTYIADRGAPVERGWGCGLHVTCNHRGFSRARDGSGPSPQWRRVPAPPETSPIHYLVEDMSRGSSFDVQ